MITDAPETLARHLVTGNFEPSAMAGVLTEMARRGETSREITALATAFKEAAVPVSTRHQAVLDLCGTGGAPFRTFNVSTISSFVVSSLGVPVAKHGNRSARGICGSADLMEALGARLVISPEEAGRMLDDIGYTFLFAPSYHPAMRNAVPVRKQLRTRTIFNMLGPLLNPVSAHRRQLLGVYSPRLLELLPPVLHSLGVERALLVHGRPGMDEVSVLGNTAAVLLDHGRTERLTIDPREIGMVHPDPSDVRELPPPQAAMVARDIMTGARGAQRDMVVLNAACGLIAFGKVNDLNVAIRKVETAIDSGRAMAKMEEFLARTGEGITS